MSKNNKEKKEIINTKEVKKEELEIEEVKETNKKETSQNTSPARAEEDLNKTEKIGQIERISKLKCNYELFKNEREKNKMFVPANCEICNKKFNKNDNIYVALDKKANQIFICRECAEGKQ